MKATELLQKQHREIEQLLERLRTAAPEEEAALRKELASLLVAHTVIEEQHFYPALREAAPDRVLEAIEEHGLADYELAKGLESRAGGEDAQAKTAVLAEVLLAHIRKEENDLFRHADSLMTNQELAEIGEVMSRQFQEVRRGGVERILAQKLAENMPRISKRIATAKKRGATTRRAASAKKQPTARGRASAQRASTQKPATQRATQSRGAAGARKAKKQTSTRAVKSAKRAPVR